MSVDLPDLKEIQQLVPDAEDLEYLAKGGFKFVYAGKINGVKEAIKVVLIPEDEKDKDVKVENIKRIEREIEIISKTKTKSLVKLGSIKPTECIIGKQTFYLYSEEFLEGEDLEKIVDRKEFISQQELKTLGKALTDCLKEFKKYTVIHRDINPRNIIRTNDSQRKFVLIDLGIAFYTAGTNFTRNPHAIPGTVPNFPPEFFEPHFRDRLDYRADLYNTGLTLYEYATGIHPFKSREQYVTISNIQKITPKPLNDLRPDLEVEFCNLVDSLLKKKPMLREANLDKIDEILNS